VTLTVCVVVVDAHGPLCRSRVVEAAPGGDRPAAALWGPVQSVIALAALVGGSIAG
jgi:hypothetical protein